MQIIVQIQFKKIEKMKQFTENPRRYKIKFFFS